MVTSIAQQSSPALEQVLSQLKGVRTSMRGWRACCPAHADRKPSLSIGLGGARSGLAQVLRRVLARTHCGSHGSHHDRSLSPMRHSTA